MTVYVFQYFLIDQLPKKSVPYIKWITDVRLPDKSDCVFIKIIDCVLTRIITSTSVGQQLPPS